MEGNLRGPSQCRVSKTFELFKAGKADHIIASSKWSMNLSKKPKMTIAEAMQRALLELGVAEKILLENTSRDTIGNVYFTLKEILVPNEWKNVIVVTSPFHRGRAEYLFRKILGPNYQVKFIESEEGLSEEDLIKQNRLEEKQLNLTKKFLDNCIDGDIEAISTLIKTYHPAYAKNPRLSVEDFFGNERSPFHEEGVKSEMEAKCGM